MNNEVKHKIEKNIYIYLLMVCNRAVEWEADKGECCIDSDMKFYTLLWGAVVFKV